MLHHINLKEIHSNGPEISDVESHSRKMSKRRRTKSQAFVTTHDDDEGYITTPVQCVSSAGGSTAISTQQVMVPLSPQKQSIAPFSPIPTFDDVLGDGYDADTDDGNLGTIHYIKAPRSKRYHNAVSLFFSNCNSLFSNNRYRIHLFLIGLPCAMLLPMPC
jgi:hypothetical protein